MGSWSESYFTKPEEISKKIPARDFRFYNISHLALLADKTESLSKHCPACKSNIAAFENLLLELSENFHERKGRIQFENYKSEIEKHLFSEHKIAYTRYFTSCFNFAGTLAGVVAGFILSFTLSGVFNINYLLIGGIIGLFAGQVTGDLIEDANTNTTGRYN